MASRDLTAVFKERRKASLLRHRRHEASSKSGKSKSSMKPFMIAGGGRGSKSSALVDDSLLMAEEGVVDHFESTESQSPLWVNDVDEVHGIFQNITTQVSLLSSLHANRLGSVFGSKRVLSEKEAQIDDVTVNITSLFREAESKLLKIGRSAAQADDDEEIVLGNVQRSLAKKLQELSADFRSKQRKYLKDVSAQKYGTSADSEEHKQFGIDLNMNDIKFDGSSQNQVSVTLDDMSGLVQSRDAEIVKIAQSIEELGTIFKELAVLVIDQGTILDRIDYNMETVVESTRDGVVQLEKAEEQQKNARAMKCIICLLCTISVLVMILVMKHTKW